MKSALAYIRVSTANQGTKGFGFDAQRAQIECFAKQSGYDIERFYVEIASGVGPNDVQRRPELLTALREAGSKGLPLIVADVDRLSRHEDTVRKLLDISKLKIVAASLGFGADKSVFLARAARGQHEVEVLRRTTKEALAVRKRSGKPLGNRTNLREAQLKGAAANARKAIARADSIRPIIKEARDIGAGTAREIRDYLNSRGVRTPRGTQWTTANIYRVLRTVRTPGGSSSRGLRILSASGHLTIEGATALRTLAGRHGVWLNEQLSSLGYPTLASSFACAQAGDYRENELPLLTALSRAWNERRATELG